MGDRPHEPAKRVPARRAEPPRAPTYRSDPTKFDRVREAVDIVITRILALATAVAVVRGQVTLEVVAALYAAMLLLRLPRSGR
jgi:hypothetical protein